MTNSIKVLLLAAGRGERLRPYTDSWPKCLMPIGDKPLLSLWLEAIQKLSVSLILVNLHYLSEIVEGFLNRPAYKGWVHPIYEPELLGTAGTLRKNSEILRNSTILLVHADNLCQCDLSAFLKYHQNLRPDYCSITMMTFQSQDPSACGIVELDDNGVVIAFYEKIKDPPGNLANGAVYLLEPQVLEWINNRPEVTDFSTQVLPHFIGKIATWKNNGVHIDIGSFEALKQAQAAANLGAMKVDLLDDQWSHKFLFHPIHKLLNPKSNNF
jgi:mannose-1-phosphate guanylyltransferase